MPIVISVFFLPAINRTKVKSVYNGGITNYGNDPDAKMVFNETRGCYEQTLLLNRVFIIIAI